MPCNASENHNERTYLGPLDLITSVRIFVVTSHCIKTPIKQPTVVGYFMGKSITHIFGALVGVGFRESFN